MKKIIIIIILLASIVSGPLCYFNVPPPAMRDRIFTVRYGETIRAIARNLERSECVKSENFFVYASYALRRRSVRAGRYRIFVGMTSIEILMKLSRGEILTRRITVPEGFNLYQIADRLAANEITDAGPFLNFARDAAFLESLNINAPSAEGYLFPDTYVFAEGSDARDIITAMRRKTGRVIGDAPHSDAGMSVHEILTLASLIEKEARIPSERDLISSVFHNRLRRYMKLDCDPTVRYAVKKFSGPIYVSDLNADSPYNTYRRGGLPPTPICSPGRESIMAALHPKKSDYLYFVAKNDGSHYFSKTLKEHNGAVRLFQRKR